MTDHHVDAGPDGREDPERSEPADSEIDADAKDPVGEADPLESLGSPDDGDEPDGSPQTSPTD